jgi:4-amino-4-deoxy-L-arabinose transferase-like glycosyltransferase
VTPIPERPDADARASRLFWFVALLVLAAGYGLRDPWPADEPRFVLVAQQMLASGEFLFPHRGHEFYPDKPPLFFWLLAAARTLLGSWRWSFLLPSLLAALGTLALVRDLGRRLWNPRAGLWAAIAVLAALQFVYQGKRAQIDPTLVFLTTLSFYGLCRHLLLGPQWLWFWAGCFAAGLGVIAKGVGFLPLLALLPYAAMRWRGWHGLMPPHRGSVGHWALGAVAFLLAIAVWALPMVTAALAGGDPEHRAYLDNILFRQTATRYAEAWHHHQPPWYFLGVIALFWLPTSLALPWLARPWRDAWRARDARVWLPLAWTVLVLAFFSASPGKRDMYILPALPALALAAAPFADALYARPGFRRALLAFVAGLGAILLALGAGALGGKLHATTAFAAERGLGAEVATLWWLLVALGVFALAAAAVGRTARIGAAVACTLAITWIGTSLVAYPLLDASSSSRQLMVDARRLAGPGTEIGLVDWKEQNLLQAVGPVEEFGFRATRAQQLARGVDWMRARPGRRLLVQAGKPGECVAPTGANATKVGVANRRTWWLAGPEAVVHACR